MLKSQKLKEFLSKNLYRLCYDVGSGYEPNLPDFELHSSDYLKFVEQELYNNTPQSLINCVAHLKRATDCQIDTFLNVCNLYKIFNERNLKFDKKLEFLKEAGIFSSRSLSRFNTMRNKMEHYYEVPKIEDIEVYYDLVAALVAILQAVINSLYHFGSEQEYYVPDEEKEHRILGSFAIGYEYEVPELYARWDIDNEKEELRVDTTEPSEFAYFFKVLLLLGQRDCFVSDNFIIDQL